MSTVRFFAATWPLPDGRVVAVLLDAPEPEDAWASAIGATSATAVRQLRKLVVWRAKREGFPAGLDLAEVKPVTFRVPVRPAHRLANGRSFELGHDLNLAVAAVLGVRGEGASASQVCFLPTLELALDLSDARDERARRARVEQQVNQHARTLDTDVLRRLLRPEAVEIASFTVREPSWKDEGRGVPTLPALRAVADPIETPAGRSVGGGAAWGRDAEVRELLERVEGQRSSAVVVAASGTGKSTVIAAAAAEARRERRPRGAEETATARWWRTSAARLIAGMRYLGEWEQRCEAIVDELAEIDGVLCVDNLLDLLRVGSAPAQSPAAFFAPFMAHGELRVVFEATPRELDACRRLLPALAGLLPVIRLDPWREATAAQALEMACKRLAEQRRVSFEPAVPALVQALFRRHLPGAALPGAAVRLLADAFAVASQLELPVDADLVLDGFASLTGLPDRLLRDNVPLERDEVLRFLTARVIGQPEPCALLSDLVAAFKAAMNPPDRPPACVLLCGPTGTGKTETAKALGDFLFPNRPASERTIRLDMSEYGGPDAAERFTTDPGGGPSNFLRRLRVQPFQVLLLDEIEKADPAVFDLLLGVLDEGRLVDEDGRLTDFRGCFVLLTSNVAGDLTGPFGFGEAVATDPEAAALEIFRPEFVNRLDAVTAFHPLDPEAVRRVVRLHLGHLANRRGLADRRLKPVFDEALIEAVAHRGFDPRYGARPLQRAMEEMVTTPLARWLVARPHVRDAPLRLFLTRAGLGVESG